MTDAPKKTERELLDVIHDERNPKPFSMWRHYKTGNAYTYLETAVSEATQEPLTLYFPCHAPKLLFVRPLREWAELVPDADGNMTPRFKPA